MLDFLGIIVTIAIIVAWGWISYRSKSQEERVKTRGGIYAIIAVFIALLIGFLVMQMDVFQKTDTNTLKGILFTVIAGTLISLFIIYAVIREVAANGFPWGYVGKIFAFVFAILIFLGAIFLLVKFIKWAWMS